jgi:hypothetical protein
MPRSRKSFWHCSRFSLIGHTSPPRGSVYPPLYLTSAFLSVLSDSPERGINNLRSFNRARGSTPTPGTKFCMLLYLVNRLLSAIVPTLYRQFSERPDRGSRRWSSRPPVAPASSVPTGCIAARYTNARMAEKKNPSKDRRNPRSTIPSENASRKFCRCNTLRTLSGGLESCVEPIHSIDVSSVEFLWLDPR